MRVPAERLLNYVAAGLPWIISAFIGAWMFFAIPAEQLLHTDEIRTAERSRGFLLTRDFWTVTEGGEPIFAKPPFQYWLTAPLIAWLGPCEYAVRLWPAIFSVGGILAAAWLAKALWPGRQWVMPLASVLVALNSTFLSHGISGLLDSGQAFGFTILALSVLKTFYSPKWWIMCGSVAGLLALQKSPAGLLFLLGCMIAIAIERRSLKAVLTPWSVAALCLAVLPAILWTALQVASFGRIACDVIIGQQIVNRFTIETQSAAQDGAQEYILGFFTSWKVCALLVLAALGSAVAIPPQRAHPMLRGLAVLVLLYGIVAAFAKPTYGRYIIAVVPIAAAVSSGILLNLASRRKWLGILLIVSLAASLPFGGLACERSRFNSNDYASQARIAKYLCNTMPPGSRLSIANGPSAVEPRIFAYYLNLSSIPTPSNLTDLRLDANEATAPGSPELFVICNAEQSRMLHRAYDQASNVMVDGAFELLRISSRKEP